MINRMLIDSSILVEYVKNIKVKLLDSLLSNPSFSCHINETIISEFYFHFLKLSTGKAPATLQSSGKINEVMESNKNYLLINVFEFLSNDRKLIAEVPILMQKYNLLPNDAIILATCKMHNITKLASHDTDFMIPCKAEGIELLREE